MNNPDDDLESMTRDDLTAEVKKLRAAIRAHRDSSGHQLCWHHPAGEAATRGRSPGVA